MICLNKFLIHIIFPRPRPLKKFSWTPCRWSVLRKFKFLASISNFTQTPLCGQNLARTWTAPAHRTPHPHRETAPAQMSPHKFSPQLRLQNLQLAFLGTTVLQSLSRCRPFFPAEKNPYFLQAGKQPYFKAIFKESSCRRSCTRFLTKKSKFEKKKKLLRFFFFKLHKKKLFFSPQSAVENKTHFFWSQSISEWRKLFFPKMAKWQNGVEINLDQKKLPQKRRLLEACRERKIKRTKLNEDLFKWTNIQMNIRSLQKLVELFCLFWKTCWVLSKF